jgi:hypothetical protein
VAGTVGNPTLLMNTGRPLVYVDRGSSTSSAYCGNTDASKGPLVTGQTLSDGPVKAAGYGAATGGTSHFSTTCASVRTQAIHLFPTSFAPAGVVQLTFQAQAMCRTNGGVYSGANPNGGHANVSYSGTVSVWSQSLGGYTAPVAFDSSNILDTRVPLTTPVAPGLTLASYVESWSSVSAADLDKGVQIDQDNNAVAATYANLARVNSAVLGPDPTSSIGVLLGAISCTAEDNR